jgi:hypothetical protein
VGRRYGNIYHDTATFVIPITPELSTQMESLMKSQGLQAPEPAATGPNVLSNAITLMMADQVPLEHRGVSTDPNEIVKRGKAWQKGVARKGIQHLTEGEKPPQPPRAR